MQTAALIVSCAVLAVASWAGVAAWKPWAKRWKLIDVPNPRSSHTEPTLRAGGVPLAILTLATVSAAPAFLPVDSSAAALLAATAALIAVTGFIDDLRSLGWRVRFGVQIATALIVVMAWGAIGSAGPLPLGILAVPLTVMWIAGLTNAYNFMDGIDGIAGIQAVVAACGWIAVGWSRGDLLIAVAAAALAATAAGFLVHNWPPATIFMGDVASGFLGFVFAVLTVKLAQQTTVAVITGALFVWPFLFDTTVTFFRRIRRRENVFAAHRSHIYQRLVIAGASHARVSALYGALAALCTVAGVALERGWIGSELFAGAAAAGTSLWLWTAVQMAERRSAAHASAEPAERRGD